MHWDIYIGQILRKLAHVDGFYRALKNPALRIWWQNITQVEFSASKN